MEEAQVFFLDHELFNCSFANQSFVQAHIQCLVNYQRRFFNVYLEYVKLSQEFILFFFME